MESVQNLKLALDSFPASTGLVINFSKSTTTPMHVLPGDLQSYMEVLRCREGTFPQTYLGLPLSNVNLPLSAFALLIAKVDRYLTS